MQCLEEQRQKLNKEISELKSNQFIHKSIATPIDANDYRGSSMNGVYSLSISNEHTNLPGGLNGGTLTVMFGASWGYQEFRTYNAHVSEIYTRNYFTSWGSWKKISLTSV